MTCAKYVGAPVVSLWICVVSEAIFARLDVSRQPSTEVTVRPAFITGNQERHCQRAERDQQIAECAVEDGKGLFAGGTGAPDRVERELERFPNKVSSSDTAEIGAQAAQPMWRCLSSRHSSNRSVSFGE
jgi:hypothetical protein